MADKKIKSSDSGLDAARLEMMRIRFRRVLGETVPSHLIKTARKNIAKCVRSLQNGEEKNA